MTVKIKRSFFQAAVVSILLYGCTTWTLTKWLEKNKSYMYNPAGVLENDTHKLL